MTKLLPIVWQGLVDPDGNTCPRCGSTRDELNSALAKLGPSLGHLGIKPTLETREIDIATFKQDPSESNRIWIANRPLEEWLGAQTSASPCCSVCGDSECRTIEIGSDAFEAVPSELIIKAALLAASEMIENKDPGDNTECDSGCRK